MKPGIFTVFLLLALQPLCAQNSSGLRSDNYTGVNGVFFNPASIADSRYRFDFNLLSLSFFMGNNKAAFNTNTISSPDLDALKNHFVGAGAGLTSFMLEVDVLGPSLMFNTGKKSAMAFTTRARAIFNMVDVDGEKASQLIDDFGDGVSYPYSLAMGADVRFIANAWTEYGVSYARILMDDGAHFLKAGLAVKYLTGAGNAYLNISRLNATLNEDTISGEYLNNATGRLDVGLGGIDISNFAIEGLLSTENTGFGSDLGVVYEFRPQHENYRSDDKTGWKRDRNKYKFKIGIALLDIGSIKYKRDRAHSGGYDVSITGEERLYLDDISDLEEYKEFFDSLPQYFPAVASSNESTYKVMLPTTVHLNLDYHLHRGFYLQLASQMPIGNENIYNSRYYRSVSFIPRYEGRGFGFSLPFNYNNLTNFNAGVSIRLGSVYIGSGSLLTAVLYDTKQIDFHFGIHMGSLQKKTPRPKKKIADK